MKRKKWFYLGIGILVVAGFFLVRYLLQPRISSSAVIKQMRELQRMETAQFTVEKIIDAGTDNGTLGNILFGDKILLIAHGNVIAGFDLEEFSQNNIRVNGTLLTINLPPPQILSVALDNSQTRVYDRRQGLLSRGDKDLERKARETAEMNIRQTACAGGILTEAAENARKQLTGLFQSVGFTNVHIEIPPGSC